MGGRVISTFRMSRLVSLAEGMMKLVDDHVRARISKIFAEKERYAYQLKMKAEQRNRECLCVICAHIHSIYPGCLMVHSRSGVYRCVVLLGHRIVTSHYRVLFDLPVIHAPPDTLSIVHPYVSLS